MHLVVHDYGRTDSERPTETLSGSFSLNAAVFASILPASRMQTPLHVFASVSSAADTATCAQVLHSEPLCLAQPMSNPVPCQGISLCCSGLFYHLPAPSAAARGCLSDGQQASSSPAANLGPHPGGWAAAGVGATTVCSHLWCCAAGSPQAGPAVACCCLPARPSGWAALERQREKPRRQQQQDLPAMMSRKRMLVIGQAAYPAGSNQEAWLHTACSQGVLDRQSPPLGSQRAVDGRWSALSATHMGRVGK